MGARSLPARLAHRGVLVSGTEWTEPGQGATWRDLRGVLRRNASYRIKGSPSYEADWHVALRAQRQAAGYDRRTNLRLTGAPLTAEDLKRIAEAK